MRGYLTCKCGSRGGQCALTYENLTQSSKTGYYCMDDEINSEKCPKIMQCCKVGNLGCCKILSAVSELDDCVLCLS